MSQDKKIKVCRTATVAYYVTNHLKSQVEYLRDNGIDIVLVSSFGPTINQIDFGNGLSYKEIEIVRQIEPLKDIVTLVKLIKFFRRHRFDIVHSTTPKAGLLSSIAATIVGVPVRLHTWTGQPWVTLKGMKKNITMFSDYLIGLLCTRCYADSPSQREFLIEKKIISSKKIKVIKKGSISGIDLERFKPGLISQERKTKLRKENGISEKSKIITFIGRINKDKGVFELIEAFKQIVGQGYDTDLLLIGPLDQDSQGDGIINLDEYIGDCSRIHFLGYQKTPEFYLSISDIFCLPSYREGFGTTVIEAAAMGVPAVGTNIVGLVDAIVDGKTGLLVELQSTQELIKAFKFLLNNPDKIKEMGLNARRRCIDNFDKDIINKLVKVDYLELIKSKKRVA